MDKFQKRQLVIANQKAKAKKKVKTTTAPKAEKKEEATGE
jgi:hypothetical protein